MTTFIGTNGADTIVPGFVSPGVEARGPDATPDATPGDGEDTLLSRAGDDVVAGGKGADTAALGAGDDTFGWAPADGSDRVFGQAGVDRLVFDGDGSGETFALSAEGGEDRLDRDVGGVTMRLQDLERIDLLAGGGADLVSVDDAAGLGVDELRIDLAAVRGAGLGDGRRDRVVVEDGDGASFVMISGATTGLALIGLPVFVSVEAADAADAFVYRARGGDDFVGATGAGGALRLTLDGGAGDDTILSGAGDDALLGGRGDDFVSGGRGDDAARLGAGSDVFVWVNGDGSDAVDGGAGRDSLSFDGAAADEAFRLAQGPNGRALLTRDLGSIRMDLASIEAVAIRALGGADTVEVADLSGTAVEAVEIVLSLPGRSGDGADDAVSLAGGAAGETIAVSSEGARVTVAGGPAAVEVFGVEAADALTVEGGGGADAIGAQGFAAGTAALTLDGGEGEDEVFGSEGADVALGGDGDDRLGSGGGDDRVFGGRGDDAVLLGAGDDLFGWAPGEGNDAVMGGDGVDTLLFLGSDADEVIEFAADGTSALLLRDVADVRMDLDAVERTDLRVFGGTDMITVGDLGGTDLAEVVLDLSGPDGAADFVVVDGTEAADDVTIGVEGDAIVVGGLPATIRILGVEGGLDQLLLRGFGGDDRIDASALAGIELFVQAGEGNDVILGSAFGDTLSGNGGDDVLLADGGDDTAFGDAGDDVLDGGARIDTLRGGGGLDVLLNGEIVGDALDMGGLLG